jgi:hypothetical protein
MRTNYFIFGIDIRATAVVTGPFWQWPHRDKPELQFGNHLFLDELDRRGVDYVCRMFADMALGLINRAHPGVFDRCNIFLPPAVGADRFIDQDSNVDRLVTDRGVMLPRHVAVGLSDSGLSLEIAEWDKDGPLAMARGIPFAELEALGADIANMTVGDIILRMLLRQHPDVFALFPNLSPQPEKGASP